MSRKAKQQLLRERDRQRKLREEQALETNAQKLKEQTGGFSRTPLTNETRAKIRRSNTLGVLTRLAADRIDNNVTRPVVQGGIKYRTQQRYEGEMEQREIAALAHYEVMKSHTAPLYNKGGLQYVPPGSADDADVRAGNTKRR